jgi:hypothetical protein
MKEENYINQEIRVRLLEELSRELKNESLAAREESRKETKQLRLELSTDLKEAIRHFDSKINNLTVCMIGGFITLMLTKIFS